MAFSLGLCKKALDTIGLEPRDVTQIVATGGVSQIPFVRRRLVERFGCEIADGPNPAEAVARGAGIRAAQLVGARLRR